MKQIIYRLLIIILILISSLSNAQVGFTRQQNVPVQVGVNVLKLPWAGGLNNPLFSEFDFNQDGIKDLFVFERVNNRIIPLINQGTANQVDYVFDPQYIHMFPQGRYWAFTHDYNCDGRNDFFTLDSLNRGIRLCRNDSINPTTFGFTVVSSELMCQYPSTITNMPAGTGLAPAFTDMDNDGDMDILTMSSGTSGQIEYEKNMSIELSLPCDSFKFVYMTKCWNDMFLPIGGNCADTASCPNGSFLAPPDIGDYDQSEAARHDDTMSCICIIDIENDGDKDLLIGGLGDTNEQMTRNGGTPSTAHADSVDCLWPSYDSQPVYINSFPCSANIDVDNDGKKDVILAPTVQENFSGVTFYKDTSGSNVPSFHFQYSAFLQRDMIEVGEGSYPAFFDYDGDGLNDIIIGNYTYFQIAGGYKSGLSLYRNTGTNTNPSFQLITRDFAGLFNSTFCTGFANNPQPTFGDIDGDGDLDMLVGDFCGHLQLYLNNGANNLTSFGVNGIPSAPNYQGIDVGSNAAPQFVDLDRDGKLDLVIGRRNGFLGFYRNHGTATNAVFDSLCIDTLGRVDVSVLTSGFACPFIYDDSGSYRLLVGNELGYVFRYGNIDGNLFGTFSIIDTIIKHEEGNRVCPGMGDINGDAVPDLLVGNYAGGVSLFYQDNPLSANPANHIEAGPGMEIFPNPARERTEIQFTNLNSQNKTVLSIFDVTGQKISSFPCSAPSLILNVHTLSAGIYLLRLEAGKHSVVRKLLVY